MANYGVRSTSGRFGAAYYAEISLVTALTGETLGLANASWNEANVNGVGGDANSIGISNTGTVYLNNSAVGTPMGAWPASGVLGVAFNGAVNPPTMSLTYNGASYTTYSMSGISASTGPFKLAYGAVSGGGGSGSISGVQSNGGGNLFGNPNFTGGTNGTTTLPTGFYNTDTDAGITITLVTTGTVNGVPYCRLTFAGTTEATYTSLFLGFPAITGGTDVATGYQYRLSGGSNANISSWAITNNLASSGGYLSSYGAAFTAPVSALQTTSVAATTPSNAVENGIGIQLFYNTSVAINVTIDIVGVEVTQGTQPVIYGSATASVPASTVLPVGGIAFADANQPLSGTCAIDIFTSNGGLVTVTPVTGGTVTNNGTASLAVADTYANCQADILTLVYTAPGTVGSDTITVEFVNQIGLSNQIVIAVTVTAATGGGVKTLNVGEQAFTYAVPSGYVAWDNYPPAAVTNLIGSPTSISVALSWTASAVGTAPITYTVQYRLHGAASWTNFATGVPVTNSTVTGLSTSTEYDFQVLSVNALGNAVVPFITATTSSGTLPGDPTGTTAFRIADMVELFGVNCFPDGQDGTTGNAASATTYAAGFNWIVGSSGLGMFNRIYANSTALDEPWITTICQSVPNTVFSSCVNYVSTSVAVVQAEATSALAAAGYLKAVEGWNEPDNASIQSGDAAIPVATALSAQQAVYSSAHPGGVIVMLPSVTDDGSGTYETDYMGADLSAFVASANWSNGHDYPNSGAPNNDMWRRTDYLVTATGLPVALTEWHPLLYNNVGNNLTLLHPSR